MKLPKFGSRKTPAARTPAPLVLPVMDAVRVDLQYHPARNGGDFFDALTPDASRLVFLFMDIAGRRVGAMEIAASAQEDFRRRTPALLTGAINEAEAVSELCMHLNRTILATAGRAHMTAAFLGVLNNGVGALTYINAGHIPGLLLTPNSTEFLESTGLPLGLFSHATHEAGFRAIPRGGALLLASRGVVEANSENRVLEHIGRNHEFGAEGVLRAAAATQHVAQSLCRTVLDSAILHAGRHVDNDMSVAAISRDAQA
jgi:serine phosphatase RsbU (regulator of sigma subunit)